jgi:hypothetical protein
MLATRERPISIGPRELTRTLDMQMSNQILNRHDTMKRITKNLVSILGLCLVALAPNLSSAQAPSGNITTNITDPTNAIWDLTVVSDLKEISLEVEDVEVDFDLDFVQNGKGKLSGAGDTTVALVVEGFPQSAFPASYNLKGSISSSKGVGRLNWSVSVSGTTFLDGADRKVSAFEKVNLKFDPVTRQIVSGNYTQKASASGLGSLTDSGPVDPQPLPDELGDGSWTLAMDIEPDAKNKYSGTASVTLASGQVYPFSVMGSHVPKTGQTKLVLKGLDAATGSSLKVTLLGNDIVGILGKVSGQAISVK